jgi:hypothetical protein
MHREREKARESGRDRERKSKIETDWLGGYELELSKQTNAAWAATILKFTFLTSFPIAYPSVFFSLPTHKNNKIKN